MPKTEANHQKKGDFFSGCVSALYYEGAVKDAIGRYKFRRAEAYDHAFGELVAARIYEEYGECYDILSWVPLSWDRRRERGYDQAECLARKAGKKLCRPVTRTLRKRMFVKPQSSTGSPSARRANISGAYRAVNCEKFIGKRVLLVDDVVTSGSTLSECAKTLLLAGAEEVLCATLARTR